MLHSQRRSFLVLIATFCLGDASAAELMVPTKEQAVAFEISDTALQTSYAAADVACMGSATGLDMFVACAKRDILAETLRHRGFCHRSECQPGSRDAWYACSLSSALGLPQPKPEHTAKPKSEMADEALP